MKRPSKQIIQVFLLSACLTTPAYAYLDPGTGSMMLQIILGGIAGLLVAGKLFWHRILVFLRIRKPQDLDQDDVEEADAELDNRT